jgi:hypothetical protein
VHLVQWLVDCATSLQSRNLTTFSPAPAATLPVQLSNLGGDDWFVKPGLQDQAFAAAQAAAEAYAMLETDSAPSSSSNAASAVSAAMLPFVDESRIAALAAVEPDTLWFMAELVSDVMSLLMTCY